MDPIEPAEPDVTVPEQLLARISRHGSVRFDEFVELALYHPGGGFFAAGGGAGRTGGDFITSPEVGPLFGVVLARYLDAVWDRLGRPDPYVVVEAAAGRGALAISVLAAGPRCAPALRYVLVERSAALRQRQADHLRLVSPFEVLGPDADPEEVSSGDRSGTGPMVCSLGELPVQPVDGVVVANELLDNLPFRLLERTATGWGEVRVTTAGDGQGFVELLTAAPVDAAAAADRLAPDALPGARLPLQDAAVQWLARAREVVRSGSVLVFDYGASTAELAKRPTGEWLRTYRGQERGSGPLYDPGAQDLTVEVAFDQLERVAAADVRAGQADWLRQWGIDELVAEGRQRWSDHAAAPDLAALRARSRVREAEALLDPEGLGGFRVREWWR
jgi:SAM-dependent MidA family methyltransferase